MKQSLKIGNMVDDGTGDYLRAGGQKLNNNFDDLYYQLGDGKNPHAAGAWKTHSAATSTKLSADFGKSYAIDTTPGSVTVNLPKGTSAQYNFVIRLRDVFSTWQRNPVTIVPAVGDTIKGSPNPVTIRRNFSDLELVYCSPGRWEYINNKSIDRIDNNDVATVASQEYIATEGQRDFMNIFPAHGYNPVNLKVYHRGNALFYGKDGIFDAANAEVGSPGTAAGQLVAYDGKNIRLRNPCRAGDTVIIVSYMDGLGQWRSSYNRKQIRILDAKRTQATTVNGSILVLDDIENTLEFTVEQFGVDVGQPVNPNACELSINSILQNQAGTAGLPEFRCEGADGETLDECNDAGGSWVYSATDFRFELDGDGIKIESIRFDKPLEHGDVVTLVWYNNNIGTTLSLEEILAETDSRYMNASQNINLTGQVRITDIDNPFWPNVESVAPTEFSPSTVASLFDVFYPIGTIYENTVNPNNPNTYMGFGLWKRMEDRVLVGWSSVSGSKFNLNNNDLNSAGVPSATAGGTGGAQTITLTKEQIPKLMTDDKVLITDPNGPIIVGGCQFDPNSQGPAYTKYREGQSTINKVNDPSPQAIDSMNPYQTVYRWMRIS